MSEDDITADTPLPFCLHKLWYDVHTSFYSTHNVGPGSNQSEETRTYELDPATQLECRGSVMDVIRPRFRAITNSAVDGVRIYKSSAGDMRGHVDTLEAKLKDPRLSFLFNPGPWAVNENGETTKDLDALFHEWIGRDKPITVLDLSGIPPSILDDLIGAVLRILYDGMFWGRETNEGARRRPLLIALEEAHAYLGSQSKSRATSAARRIAKEGRKYGVGLMLVSQRPSEIDPTILSQCGTMVAMRLTNESDRSQIRSCASDNLDGLFSMLPVLRTGEALIVGEAVGIPLRALIEPPPKDKRPDGDDPKVVVPLDTTGQQTTPGGWTDTSGEENYAHLVNCWRLQDVFASEKEELATEADEPKNKE